MEIEDFFLLETLYVHFGLEDVSTYSFFVSCCLLSFGCSFSFLSSSFFFSFLFLILIFKNLSFFLHLFLCLLYLLFFSPCRSDQIRSVAQLCPTLCDPINHSTPGLPVHHQLPEFTQTHVH